MHSKANGSGVKTTQECPALREFSKHAAFGFSALRLARFAPLLCCFSLRMETSHLMTPDRPCHWAAGVTQRTHSPTFHSGTGLAYLPHTHTHTHTNTHTYKHTHEHTHTHTHRRLSQQSPAGHSHTSPLSSQSIMDSHAGVIINAWRGMLMAK